MLVVKVSNFNFAKRILLTKGYICKAAFSNKYILKALNFLLSSGWKSRMQESAVFWEQYRQGKQSEAGYSQKMISCSIYTPPKQFWECCLCF
jgi:hypothetical protein